MSVKKEPSGRRSVQVEVEVSGTPEQVWQAIATGPGISAWFVPAKVDGRVGGAIRCTFGPGMETSAEVTEWQPPHRFAAIDKNGIPGGPALATEWTVEARAGGTCTVRVVHSLFASTDDWDDQLESVESGWPTFFRVLRLYLAYHAGEPSALVQALACPTGSADEAWAKLTGALGLGEPKAGQRVRLQIPGTALAGPIERVDHVPNGHSLLMRVSEPVPGAAFFGAHDCNGMLLASLQLYLYGDQAAATAARDEEHWQKWLVTTFPATQPT